MRRTVVLLLSPSKSRQVRAQEPSAAISSVSQRFATPFSHSMGDGAPELARFEVPFGSEQPPRHQYPATRGGGHERRMQVGEAAQGIFVHGTAPADVAGEPERDRPDQEILARRCHEELRRGAIPDALAGAVAEAAAAAAAAAEDTSTTTSTAHRPSEAHVPAAESMAEDEAVTR